MEIFEAVKYKGNIQLLDHVVEVLSKNGFEQTRIDAFKIAVDEIYTNAERENLKFNLSGPSFIREVSFEDAYCIVIGNKGDLDIDKIPKKFSQEAMLKAGKDNQHGRGLMMALYFSDKMVLNYDPKMNLVEAYVLIKKDSASIFNKDKELELIVWN